MDRRFLLAIIALLTGLHGIAQTGTVIGQITETASGVALVEAEVILLEANLSTVSDPRGNFMFQEVPAGTQTLTIEIEGAEQFRKILEVVADETKDLGLIEISGETLTEDPANLGQIPVVTLESDDFGQDEANNVSGLLMATRDVFLQSSRFTWGTRRYRARGLDNRNQQVFVNGISVNDMEFGRPSFWLWSGLNDATRNGVQIQGIVPLDFGFGGLVGGSELDIRASSQRSQLQATLSLANLNYTQRAMLSYGSGWTKGGWAFAGTLSRRLSQEGYIPGTFYDSYGYYGAISRKLNEKQALHLTVMGAPNKRGRNSATVQEMYDLAGSNYYNSFWGYQEGEKRNARVAHGHVPFVTLAHDLSTDGGFKLTTSVGYQNGTNGGTALDWFQGRNPIPDYYRRLPSYIEDPEVANRVAAELRNNESLRQLDWESFYLANANNFQTVQNANGDGESISGLQSQYVVEDRRYDTESLDFRSTFFNPLGDNNSLQGGVSFRSQTKENFKLVDDLLGGDFYLDVDKFSVGDLTLPPNSVINNLLQPNHVASEGDTIGYSYDTDIREASAWLQLKGETSLVDYFISLRGSRNEFWRTGNWKNGKFPDNSLGESERLNFFNYGLKGGVTFKINGRNYLFLNGMTGTRAPFARNSFVAPRVRNEVIPDLTHETFWGTELTYNWRSPRLKVRATGYINEINDQIETRGVFIDDGLQTAQGLFFGNYITSNLDSRHVGIEAAAEYKLTSALSINGAVSRGQYFYTDRANLNISIDNVAEYVVTDLTSYTKNFYIDGTPQTAYKVGLAYWGPKFWSMFFDVSYLDDLWLDFNSLRRSTEGIAYANGGFVEEDSDLWEQILHQEKGNAGVFIDFTLRKSIKIGSGKFLIGSISVNNLLDKQDWISGGYEQSRFDYEDKEVGRFPPRYYYGFGRTFFLNLTYRMY
ncbi:MAG: TonB-dependent receptor [Saprospiraceae bacterium]|nr:TonB-dependent receptor [Saprospiraceae bacterium]